MKKIISFSIFILLCFSSFSQKTGTLTDVRDNKVYKTVKIGDQWWMSENLAYKPNSGNFWTYEDNEKNVPIYGYLYDFKTAENICPTGWHIPNNDEWEVLSEYLGGWNVEIGRAHV